MVCLVFAEKHCLALKDACIERPHCLQYVSLNIRLIDSDREKPLSTQASPLLLVVELSSLEDVVGAVAIGVRAAYNNFPMLQ